MKSYFTLAELTRSTTARQRGIDNTPPIEIIPRLEALVANVLNPVREMWGKPIRVNSGYRSPALNRAVGGAAKSGHMEGEAADITTGNPADNKRLFDMIAASDIPFEKLIDEKNYAWIHISYKRGATVQKILHL